MKKHSLVWGAAFLLLCNFISKVLGFLYRIVMVRVIGTEGIGLTEMVTPIYSFCLVVATLGIPLAMSRLITAQISRNHYQNIAKIWRISLFWVSLFGCLTTVLVFLLAPWLIKHFIVDQRTLFCFQVMIPSIFIVSICSCYRGYFQATKQIGIIGTSQNLEQIVRVIIGIGLAILLLPYGLTIAIIAVAIATVLGELAGLCYIMIKYKKAKLITAPQQSATLSGYAISKYLFQIGTPVTMQKLLMSFLLMLQAFLIPWCLQKSGMTAEMATNAYGNYAGVAMSLIHLPGIFTSTLSVAILPAIAESTTSHYLLENRINQSFHITTAISLPVTAIFYLYAEELCTWLFDAPNAAPALQILAIGALFFYLQTTITSILQGLGNVKALLLNLFLSGICFLVGLYLLAVSYTHLDVYKRQPYATR